MQTLFELLPPKQLGSILLGCSPAEVMQVFGVKLTWEEWMGATATIHYNYPGWLLG
jgi:hypothetical protein